MSYPDIIVFSVYCEKYTFFKFGNYMGVPFYRNSDKLCYSDHYIYLNKDKKYVMFSKVDHDKEIKPYDTHFDLNLRSGVKTVINYGHLDHSEQSIEYDHEKNEFNHRGEIYRFKEGMYRSNNARVLIKDDKKFIIKDTFRDKYIGEISITHSMSSSSTFFVDMYKHQNFEVHHFNFRNRNACENFGIMHNLVIDDGVFDELEDKFNKLVEYGKGQTIIPVDNKPAKKIRCLVPC